MNPTRFDRLTRQFARPRMSRRAALVAGLAATGSPTATAPDAKPASTPVDRHPDVDTAQPHPEYLFVQPFDAGAWAPKAGEDGVYTLTLTGVGGHTTYFSDRPERVVGLAPIQPFLDGLGFSPENPPNAAIVAQTGTGETDVLVVELFDPVYDADADTLTCEAKVLADYGGRGLAHLARQQADGNLPASFGGGSLFIDDCADSIESCWLYYFNPDGSSCTERRDVGNIISGNCWSPDTLVCRPCASYATQCYSSFPSDCTDEAAGWCYDDIALCGTPGCCGAQGGCPC